LEKENIFEKSVTTREGTPYVEGPPSANGLPIHHVMAHYQRYFADIKHKRIPS
jgi:hypothetical protein